MKVNKIIDLELKLIAVVGDYAIVIRKYYLEDNTVLIVYGNALMIAKTTDDIFFESVADIKEKFVKHFVKVIDDAYFEQVILYRNVGYESNDEVLMLRIGHREVISSQAYIGSYDEVMPEFVKRFKLSLLKREK